MMKSNFDIIVLGLGGMGAATLDHVARQGLKVLGLEQFPTVHDRGSSHGHTRIIREAYHEHPSYVPFVRRAYQLWYDLEQRLGRHLLTNSPCLVIGPEQGDLVSGVRTSTRLHNLNVQYLRAGQIHERFPAFDLPDEFVGMLEHNAGFLFVEECVRAHLDSARASGFAQIHDNERVLAWKATSHGVEVHTEKGTYSAAKLIITAGAWATKLLADVGVPLKVMRQVLLWFAPRRAELFRRDKFPIYIMGTPAGEFYGLPMIDERGQKVARHYGAPELDGPDAVDWTTTPRDDEPVRRFLQTYIPEGLGPRTHAQVCMYTLSPDRHFVIDLHPRHSNVAFACGFSGHGFKFSSAVGEALAELAIHGRTSQDLTFLNLDRFRK